MLSGIDINNINDVDGALQRAAGIMLQKIDVPEASGIQNITLYSGVFDYLCNSTIFGTSLVDIRPQGITRPPWDSTIKRSQEQFDRTKQYLFSGTMATFEYNNGTPIIRIASKLPKQQQWIDPMNAIGNWQEGGTASGLTVDSSVFYQSPASLRFTLGVGTGNLFETLSSPINMSSYQGVGVAFLAVQIPNSGNLTGIQLELGSNNTNYSSVTATQGFLGTWQANDWLLVAFDFSTATNTGSPNWSAINYVNLIFTTSGTETNIRVGGLWISQPFPAQILYQSNAIFIPVGSQTPQTTITENTDTIILNDAAYTIYQCEAALAVAAQSGGGAADSTIARIETQLNGARARNGMVISDGLYDLYRGDNPSQQLRLVGNYYDDTSYQGGSRGGY